MGNFLLGFVTLCLAAGLVYSSHHRAQHTESEESPNCSPFVKSSPLLCEDLQGTGTLDATCVLEESVYVERDVCIAGLGNLTLASDVTLNCALPGCTIAVNITGDLLLRVNASVVAGTVVIQAENAYLRINSTLSSHGLGGSPPAQTSGTPSGVDGAGGGHGGRGACCASKDQNDIWGGDVYAWSSLARPWSYGSRGGSSSREVDYGGGGGGRVNVTVLDEFELNGTINADGGSVGDKGGGGSGGSVIVRALRMKGSGSITARGGDGRGGGGGGRVAIDCRRQEDVNVYVHGGDTLGCSDNAGAAGTLFYVAPQSLVISNTNKSTATDTPLLDFPIHPLWANVEVQCRAKVVVPLLWSRVLVRGQIHLSNEGTLIFGLAHYPSSEFELVADQVVMDDSIIKVYGALKLSVKMLLMTNSVLQIDGGGDVMVSTSTMEASSLVFIKGKSVLQSNTNLGVHGQGMLKLAGAGDYIRAQRLFLSLFYNIHIGPGAMLLAPPDQTTSTDESVKLYCDSSSCPVEIINPPEDCTLNVSLPFTLQICRVEDIAIDGIVRGSVVHLQRGRSVTVNPGGVISATGLGCKGGLGKGYSSSSGAGGGGGFGGRGGKGFFKGSWSDGGGTYGKKSLPCELGSGGGNSSSQENSSSGGGIVVMGSQAHPLSALEVYGSITADGESLSNSSGKREKKDQEEEELGGSGGGSGGSVLLFLQHLALGTGSVLSAAGGEGGYVGGGGGGGGRIHFHWANVATGDAFVPIATTKGVIHTNGGSGGDIGYTGDEGTVTGRECPSGLFGVFCVECPVGTYKNDTGSDSSLCKPCPPEKLPRRASYVYVRGGAVKPGCPYQCTSDKYRMPNCYTPLEELIYALGGPWLFTLLLSGLMIALALVLSIARAKLVGADDFSGPAPAPQGAHIDHSFPFLESLNEVLETTRVEESQSHVHRMFFMGCNSFAEPWHLPHTPPDQIVDLVYEDAFNRFVDEINCVAAYHWWEGSLYSILSFLAYPVAWSWQQWRRRRKVQQLRDYVRSEYDHACLRSCRSRALYEGLKVAATPDLILGYIDVFLGGDEKRPDLPPRLLQRLPMTIIFGGDGSYMAPYNLHSDNLLTSLMGQVVPATIWYRMVAGLNAQLRLVRKGRLRSTLVPVIDWLNAHVNPRLALHGVRVDLAWFQATASGYYQLGVVLNAADAVPVSPDVIGPLCHQQPPSRPSIDVQTPLLHPHRQQVDQTYGRRRAGGGVIDTVTLRTLDDSRDVLYPLSLLLHNTRPVGHHALVGLVISILLLADFSLTLLLLLQFYSISLDAFLVVLLVLPLASLLPFPAGINALFSHGPRKAAGLARLYNLWNVTSLTNTVAAFASGFFHYKFKFSSTNLTTSSTLMNWTFNSEENSWWLIPVALVVCKCTQARIVDCHIANLEIQDRTVYTEDPSKFWES